MWILLLLGCDDPGPGSALTTADRARVDHDLGRYEDAVDVETVVPQMYAICERLRLRADLEERQFDPPGGPLDMDLATDFGDLAAWAALQREATRQPWIDAFRATFPAPPDGCPELGVPLAGAPLEEGWPGRWHAAHDAGWDLTIADTGSWQVVAVDGERVISLREDQAVRNARAEALELLARLGGDAGDWSRLRNYVARHPEQADLAIGLATELARVEAEPSLLPTDRAGLLTRVTVVPTRHLAAEVTLDAPVADLVVRFTRHSEGSTREIVARTGPLAPGTWRISTPAGGSFWDGGGDVDAKVIAVAEADGRIARHPALVAGAWRDAVDAVADVTVVIRPRGSLPCPRAPQGPRHAAPRAGGTGPGPDRARRPSRSRSDRPTRGTPRCR